MAKFYVKLIHTDYYGLEVEASSREEAAEIAIDRQSKDPDEYWFDSYGNTIVEEIKIDNAEK